MTSALIIAGLIFVASVAIAYWVMKSIKPVDGYNTALIVSKYAKLKKDNDTPSPEEAVKKLSPRELTDELNKAN